MQQANAKTYLALRWKMRVLSRWMDEHRGTMTPDAMRAHPMYGKLLATINALRMMEN